MSDIHGASRLALRPLPLSGGLRGRLLLLGLVAVLLCACGGGGSDSADGVSPPLPPPVTPPVDVRWTVGGTVAGLAAGQTLVLQNQGTDDYTVGANGSFVMAASWPAGSRYELAIKTQPMGQLCTVARGSGTLSATVTDVAVACEALPSAMYTLGGTVSGMTAGTSLVLHTSAGEDFPIAADGRFTFVTPLPGGADYTVTVQSAPAGVHCAVRNGVGTMPHALVDWLSVRCTVPGDLPQGQWQQEACQPASVLGVSSRSVYQFSRAGEYLSYNEGWVGYQSAGCPGEGRFNPGPMIGARTFTTEHTESTQQFTVFWGTSRTVQADPKGIKEVWVRKDDRFCMFNDASIVSLPDSAGLDATIRKAIADGKCYTFR